MLQAMGTRGALMAAGRNVQANSMIQSARQSALSGIPTLERD